MDTTALKKAIDDLALAADQEHDSLALQAGDTARNLEALTVKVATLEARVAVLETEEPPIEPPVDPPVEPPVPPAGLVEGKLANTVAGTKKAITATTNGNFTTNTHGQVIEQRDIKGNLIVNHNDVIVRNCKMYQIDNRQGDRLLVEDSVVDGQNNRDDAIKDGGITLRRVDIKRANDGIKASGNTIMENCWVHDLWVTSTSHNDGAQVMSGSNCRFTNNRFENFTGTAGIFLKPDFGAISNITVEGNYTSKAGNFAYQADPQDTTYPTGIIYRNNVFGPVQTNVSWASTHRINAKNVTWTNNKKEDGTIVPL